MLLEINGRTFIECIVDSIITSFVKEIIIVVGHEQEKVVAALDGYDIGLVENPDFKQGMSTSIRAGLEVITGKPDAVLVCLGDMPLITSATVNLLITAFNPSAGREICVPIYRGKRGNPVLWSNRFIHEMMLLKGDTGARSLLTRYQKVVQDVVVPDSGVLVDFDTLESIKAENRIKLNE